jgi:putative addiction module killer protein
MTGVGAFAEVSSCVQTGNLFLVGADLCVRPGLRAHTQVRPYKYRVYFVQRGQTLVILLAGGDKNTQHQDIQTAQELAQKL